jgi:cytochrome P450
VLSMLITPDEKHQELSDTEITDQIITLFLAGTESTASVLAWALHVLGGRPDLEKRLHAEVDAVLSGAAPTFADVPALELTYRIVTEILRLYPPGWLFTRVATTDTQLGGHPIPAGTTVIYSPYLIQRSNSLYTDAELFDPDRWGSPHVTGLSRGAFVAFSAGPRKCLGDTFAMTEATLALAYIASRWRLRPVPGREVQTTVDTTLRPRGLHMRVEAR